MNNKTMGKEELRLQKRMLNFIALYVHLGTEHDVELYIELKAMAHMKKLAIKLNKLRWKINKLNQH